MISCPITPWQIDGETMETATDFIWGGSKITANGDCSHEIKRHLLLGRKAVTNLDSILKSRDTILLTKVHQVKAMFFSSSQVWMWELDHKESWVLKSWCFWTVVLEKTLESPLDYKEIQPVSPKGDESLIFTGRADAEAETPILWPSDAKNWLIGKDPDAGKDWRREEKREIEDEKDGWHHWLNGHEFEWALGVVMDREAWCAAIHGVKRVWHDWATELKWRNEIVKFAEMLVDLKTVIQSIESQKEKNKYGIN